MVDQLTTEENLDSGTPIRTGNEPRRVISVPYDLSVGALTSQINDHTLVLEADIQRPYMWSNIKASRLIESLLLNVPIPVCYFSEDHDGTYEVIDGHQRLGTIDRFLRGELRLVGLNALPEVNGKLYRELSQREQRAILTRTIRCVVLTQESQPEVKFDVFERLNTGAVTLSAQELRNCIYRGPFNDMLKLLARDHHILQLLGRKRPGPRMRDEELILRFLAFRRALLEYRPPLRQFLNEFAETNRFALEAVLSDFASDFVSTLEATSTILGSLAFRGIHRNEPERTLNVAVFDAEMLNLAPIRDASVQRRSQVREIVLQLLKEPLFADSIRGATADRVRVYRRIGMLSERLASVGLDNGLTRSLQFAD